MIVVVARHFPPTHGGIETYMDQVCRQLSQRRQIRVLTSGSEYRDDDNFPFEVTRIRGSSNGLFLLRAMITLLRWRRSFSYVYFDQVHTAVLGALLMVPYSVFCYGMEVTNGRKRLLKRIVFRRAREVIGITNFITEEVVARYAPERTNVLRPAVQRIPDVAPKTSDERSFTLLTVARLVDSYKGIDRVLDGLSRLEFSLQADVQYLIVGDGPDRVRLQALVSQLKLTASITFLGVLGDDQLSDVYRKADAFILVSRNERTRRGFRGEGFGIVYLEASAYALPIIAGKVGGVPEAVEDGVSGILVDPEDPSSISDSIRLLITDRALRRLMGIRGRERVEKEFLLDNRDISEIIPK